ncbi:OmpA family protein [Alloacidobacterium dinghuense]|uniref:OmpA family protein n=1 Tax=Alloacidobacterium dinghuense TaxID=2763107 RepID=A0A7G8BJU5_9BACT|nr:OmpA family protein [Alloacidobacterium dinghuense]QNI32815.1 OmpA family protein [Alloacidobacterium dinghuense]
MTTKNPDLRMVATLVLATALGIPALAQSNTSNQSPTPPPTPNAQVQTGTSASGTSNGMNPGDNSTYATGQPLPTKSNEGFWGHMNPFARKKWVNRQLDPVKDRLNELDQLTAKNANDIKDVDSRAQAGIKQAQGTADQASQTAQSANSTANQAQTLAQNASDQTGKLNTTVSGLDQYSKVSDTEIHFRSGQTALNAKAKDALDQIATQLQGQKGYIVEVEGYSRTRGQAGIQSSQHMADAVVRYLVTEHQIPVYRIHQVAMGNAQIQTADGTSTTGSVVRVSTMQNSLAALNSTSSNAGSPIGATQQSSAQPSPQGAASQPAAQPHN